MSSLKFRSASFFIGACFLAFSTLSVGILITAKSISQQADAYYTPSSTYTNGDVATYYSGISESAEGTTLLSSLRSLNSTKRQKTMGYSSMGTSASTSPYVYTDYNPDGTKYTDSNGQVYGAELVSFYTKTPMTSYNKEHVWPDSRGGNLVEADIHMPRPTISAENSSRGNSFFVEGVASSTSGWDPYTAGYDIISRGEAARITFYCTVASSSLSLVDLTNDATGNNTMGKLSDMLKWNLEYNVTQYENNRNEGAEYLQGNRNPFIDHPEYACKIWGDTNSTTQSICASSQTAPNTITVSPSTSSIAVGGNVTLTANVDTGSSSVTWSSSNNSFATVSNGVVTGVAAGTATITATSTINTSIKGTATITVKSLSSLSLSGTATNKSYSAGQSFNPAGLTVTATYSDSSTANVTSSVAWTPSPLTQGTTSVTGSYGGKTVSVSGLTVTAPVGYSLVTSASQLAVGDSLIFAYKTGSVTAGALSSTYLTSISDATFSTDLNTITSPGTSTLFTLGGTSGAWTFTNSSEALLYSSAAKNINFTSGTSTWTISVESSGDATIASTNTSYGTLQYNTGAPRFTTYTSSLALIQIYHQVSTPTSVAVTGVSLAPSSLNLTVGNISDLTATISPSNATNQNVSWSSNNSSTASVIDGTVTANAAGSATITVTTSDGSFTDTCSVSVTAPVEKTLSSIAVSGYQTSFEVGDTFSFGGAVTATYSDSSTADVTSSSSFTGYNMSTEGTQTVTASYTYGSTTKTSTYQITVTTPTTPVDSGTYTIGWGTATGTTGTFTNFSAVTGSVADILSFTSAKNSATSAPAYNATSQELRLYYVASGDGCSTTITPVEGITFTGFVVTASSTSYTPTVKYSVNGGTATSISASSTTYTVTGLSASTSLTIQNGNTTNTQLRIKTIALTYSVAGQSEKIVNSLSASYTGGDVYVDGSLNASLVNVTASYTDSATYPNAILNSSDYSLSGFSSSTAGQKTVTVTYTGSLSTSSTPMTTTFNVNVVTDTLTNVSVANSNTYHPGETITKSDITVTLAYASGASTTTSNFTFDSEGYQFTYADANSGGSNTSKQFSVVYSGNSYDFSVNVSRVSYSVVSDSTNALAATEFNGSTVSKSSGTPSSTAVTIGGANFTVTTNAYVYSSCLSFAKTAGSINNSTAFSSDLTSVSYVQKSGSRQDAVLTISKDGNTWATYSEAEIANGGYRFFKIEYVGTSTLYSNISSISFTLAGEDSAVNVTNYVMYEDTDNQCTTKLSETIDKLNTMSATEKNIFWTSSDYAISTARERLLAWATHEGKELTYSDGVFQISNSRNITSFSDKTNNSILITVISMFGLTAVGGFFFLKRKKEN